MPSSTLLGLAFGVTAAAAAVLAAVGLTVVDEKASTALTKMPGTYVNASYGFINLTIGLAGLVMLKNTIARGDAINSELILKLFPLVAAGLQTAAVFIPEQALTFALSAAIFVALSLIAMVRAMANSGSPVAPAGEPAASGVPGSARYSASGP
jgi:hypothetical protein